MTASPRSVSAVPEGTRSAESAREPIALGGLDGRADQLVMASLSWCMRAAVVGPC